MLKEWFRGWYCAGSSRVVAEAALAQWKAFVRDHGPALLRALCPMLRLWRKEIFNYNDLPYTNAFLEGKNNRIKVIRRTAFGYRNPQNFRQRILLSNRQEARPIAT